MIITSRPKSDTIWKEKPTNLKPIFKNNGTIAQSNSIKPIIIDINPAFEVIFCLHFSSLL